MVVCRIHSSGRRCGCTWRRIVALGQPCTEAHSRTADARIEEARREAAQADEKAARANADVAAATKELVTLQRYAAEAKMAQQRVELELGHQQERAARAEKALLELKTRLRARHLSPDQRRYATAALRGVRGHIEVSCLGGSDPEPCDLAREIVEALRAADWHVEFENNGGLGFIVLSTIPQGVDIAVRGSEAAPFDDVQAPPRARELFRVLAKSGLEPKWRPHPAHKPDAVALIIGAKPIR